MLAAAAGRAPKSETNRLESLAEKNRVYNVADAHAQMPLGLHDARARRFGGAQITDQPLHLEHNLSFHRDAAEAKVS